MAVHDQLRRVAEGGFSSAPIRAPTRRSPHQDAGERDDSERSGDKDRGLRCMREFEYEREGDKDPHEVDPAL